MERGNVDVIGIGLERSDFVLHHLSTNRLQSTLRYDISQAWEVGEAVVPSLVWRGSLHPQARAFEMGTGSCLGYRSTRQMRSWP